MFIIWGSRVKETTLGNLGAIWRCDHCNNDSHYRVFKRATWFTLFWIPIFPYSTKYYVTCPVCGYGKEMKKAEAEELMAQYGSSMV